MDITNRIRVGVVGLGMVGDPIRRWLVEMKGYKQGKDLFCFDTDKKKGFNDDVNQADIIFVAVPTPSPKGGGADTSVVEKVVGAINDGKIVVIKSTIPPGTAERLQKKFPSKKILFSPEFLTESQVWSDFVRPDRQIIGPSSVSSSETKEVQMLLPLAPFSRPWSSDYSKKTINATEAELSKYASNVFGALKVVYGNILADISHAITEVFNTDRIDSKVDYERVREVMSADPRIGPAWFDVNHGNYCGYGGYCFPKDINALTAFIEKDLITPLSKSKKADKKLAAILKKGADYLKAARDYNRALLQWQGLTEKGVSVHDKNINIAKRKPIRVSKTYHGK